MTVLTILLTIYDQSNPYLNLNPWLFILTIVLILFLIYRYFRSKVDNDRMKGLQSWDEKVKNFEKLNVSSSGVNVLDSTVFVNPEEGSFGSFSVIGKVLDGENNVEEPIEINQAYIQLNLNSLLLTSPNLPIDSKSLELHISVQKELLLLRSPSTEKYYLDLSFIDALKEENFGYIPLS